MFRDSTYNEMSRTAAVEHAASEFAMDEELFRGFYERTARGLWAYLARVTGSPETADDLLQETFYRFLRASATYENETHRRNSLYRIATNLARDAARRVRSSPLAQAPEGALDNASAGDHARATERSTDVNRALAAMKPTERAMLWLAYAEGASHDEIAGALGLRTASLKPLLSRARKKMAALLGCATDGGAR